MIPFVPTYNRTALGRWWWTVDTWLLAAILCLAFFGIAMVVTASPAVADRIHAPTYTFVKKQLFFMLPTLVTIVGVSFLSPKHVWRFATIALPFTMLAVLLTPFQGMEIKGAHRWIHFLGLSVQPSEFMKPLATVTFGWLLAQYKIREGFPGILLAGALYLVCALLLMAQPDFGMTVVLTLTFGAQILLLGFPLRYMVVLGSVASFAGVGAYFLFDHVRSRIDRFLDPNSGDTFQMDRSLDAFQNGGLSGLGIGEGQVKLHLPDAHTDFIFSVVAEEMGLLVVVFLICAYFFILTRGILDLRRTNSVFCMLAGGGLLVQFGLQTLVHMASATELMPAKGMTLPLVSYGGSSLIAIALTLGMILALTRSRPDNHRRTQYSYEPNDVL